MSVGPFSSLHLQVTATIRSFSSTSDPLQRMSIDIISWRQTIGVFIPFSSTVPTINKIYRRSRNFAETNNNQDTSFFRKTFLFLFSQLPVSVIILSTEQYLSNPSKHSLEAYNYDSCPSLKQENNSVTCPSFTNYMEQYTAIDRHSTALLLISRSMDVHPNPGPTAVPIIRDLTTPEQRKLFNNAKRLQLEVARYEHHISIYNYYHMHKMIPKGLAIKCRPSIEAHSERFLRNWTTPLKKTSFKMMSLSRSL